MFVFVIQWQRTRFGGSKGKWSPFFSLFTFLHTSLHPFPACLQIELTLLPSPLPCSVNNGDCPQLCLASNSTHRLCACSQQATCNETCECTHARTHTHTHRDNYNFLGMAGQDVRGYMCLTRHVYKMAGHFV